MFFVKVTNLQRNKLEDWAIQDNDIVLLIYEKYWLSLNHNIKTIFTQWHTSQYKVVLILPSTLYVIKKLV